DRAGEERLLDLLDEETLAAGARERPGVHVATRADRDELDRGAVPLERLGNHRRLTDRERTAARSQLQGRHAASRRPHTISAPRRAWCRSPRVEWRRTTVAPRLLRPPWARPGRHRRDGARSPPGPRARRWPGASATTAARAGSC